MSDEEKDHLSVIEGQPGSPGKVYGPLRVVDLYRKTVHPRKIPESAVRSELSKFESAREKLSDEIGDLMINLNEKKSAKIIDSLKEIIFDPQLEDNVRSVVTAQLLAAEYAVYHCYEDFIEKLKESGSELFRQRISDLSDLRDRMISIISGQAEESSISEGEIVVAQDLSPTDLIRFYEQGVGGIIMERGGVTSHAAIIAQSLDVPCVVSAKGVIKAAEEKKYVAMDGATGNIYLDPESSVAKIFKKKATGKNKNTAFKRLNHKTADGSDYHLRANVEFEQELKNLKEIDHHGIGLLRTESLLFNKSYVSTEEQIRFYTRFFEETSGPVTIRLFDIGGDKLGLRNTKEDNPFLGWRGVRVLLDEKKILDNQMRALLKVASEFKGRLNILIPMVSVVEEFREVRAVFQDIQGQIEDPDESVKLGLMIEVPSAALNAEHFAKEADFFSIGTNDLTQYTLAVDRGNEKISSLFRQMDPGVLKLIKLTCTAADDHNIPVAVCGELAGMKAGAAFLLGLGVNNLSMLPKSIPVIHKFLSKLKRTDLQEFSENALRSDSADKVFKYFDALS